MAIGAYNKKFKPARTRADWVTSDKERLEAYVSDPLCSFVFTVNGYYHMFGGMKQMERKESVYMIPKDLPILFAAGTDDPAGNCGKGVRKVYEKYKASGIQDVTLQLYAGDRHELLNETDREQVYEDLRTWMESRI
jgi:alpha-beta hydrolase superfamily lysophospholipase